MVLLDRPDGESIGGIEIREAIGAFGNGKAPGLDLIEVEVFKVAVHNILSRFTLLYNTCLGLGVFPRC